MRKFGILLLAVFVFMSCSKGDDPEEFIVAEGKGIVICDGYGIFENQLYDCGWKRGYEDWVYHYNSVVNGSGYPECYLIRTVQYANGEVSLVWNTIDNSYALIQQTQNQYQSYFDTLLSNQEGDFNQGKIAGYLAGRGQLPYAANDDPGDCDIPL